MKICDTNPGGCPTLCFALFCFAFCVFARSNVSLYYSIKNVYSLSLERMTKRNFKINSVESAWGRNYPTSQNYWDFEAWGRFEGFFLCLSILGDIYIITKKLEDLKLFLMAPERIWNTYCFGIKISLKAYFIIPYETTLSPVSALFLRFYCTPSRHSMVRLQRTWLGSSVLMFLGKLSGLLTNFYWSNQHTSSNRLA